MFLNEMHKDFKEFSSKNSIFLSLVFLLVLVYPLFMLSVEHWSSGIYSLLCLISIGYLFKKNEFKYPDEVKIYAWIVLLFFASILVSSTLNDWTYNSYRRLGMELKILVFIPLFLLMAKHIAVRKWFAYSIPFAGIVLGLHGVFDVLIFDEKYANASYGKIITGDISGLLVGLSGVLFIYSKDKFLKYACVIAMLLAAITCIISVSRNGWLVLIFNAVFLLFLSYNKNKKLMPVFIILPVIAFILAGTILNTERNLDAAVDQFNVYMNDKDKSQIDLRRSSIGYRLGQWQAAWAAFPEKPIFGFGPGNSSLVINDYIEKGLADPDLYHKDAAYNMGHVHSQYFDTLLVQGIVGLVLVLLMLFYPLWVFIKYYKGNEVYANLGIVLVASYAIAGLTEIPFISDNFTSIYFMYMAVFYLNVIDNISLPEHAST